MAQVDHRELLKKYMKMILEEEGVAYYDFHGDFSPEEHVTLLLIEKEIWQENPDISPCTPSKDVLAHLFSEATGGHPADMPR